MLVYCEVIPYRGVAVVWRTRTGDHGLDTYSGRDTRTGRATEGHASMRAVLRALGFQ